MSDIQSIAIVGGGTTGWLAACFLQRALDAVRATPLPITVIEAPQIAGIDAGMATLPTLRGMLQALGLPESALLDAADATLSNGVRFHGWRNGGAAHEDAYDHPFDAPPPFSGFATTAHWLNLMQRGLTQQPMAEACTVQTTLFDGHQSPKLMDSPDYQAPVSYGYHLDPAKLAMLLQQTALRRGVRHVQGEVVGVQRGGDGIESVQLADGRRFAASFFIDCTGASSLLLQQALGVPWVSHADWLPCDRRVSLPIAHTPGRPTLRSHASITAQAAGWSWDFDLQSRRGSGHVYASRFCSDDEALVTLRRLQGDDRPLAEPSFNTLRCGHAARVWDGNCLALGPAAGAVEPLESTDLHLVEWLLQVFVDHVAPSGNSGVCRDRLNRLAGGFHEELRDFAVAHYALSQRRDTPFWRACTDPAALPPRLVELLALWDAKVPTATDLDSRLSPFGPSSWSYVLTGMHRLPSRGIGLTAHISAEVSLQAMEHVRGIRRAASEQSPSMLDYLRRQRSVAGYQTAH